MRRWPCYPAARGPEGPIGRRPSDTDPRAADPEGTTGDRTRWERGAKAPDDPTLMLDGPPTVVEPDDDDAPTTRRRDGPTRPLGPADGPTVEVPELDLDVDVTENPRARHDRFQDRFAGFDEVLPSALREREALERAAQQRQIEAEHTQDLLDSGTTRTLPGNGDATRPGGPPPAPPPRVRALTAPNAARATPTMPRYGEVDSVHEAETVLASFAETVRRPIATTPPPARSRAVARPPPRRACRSRPSRHWPASAWAWRSSR
ncbi:MAG: hypothetical protein R3F59_28440 [Myxococcota bacterium]